MAVSPAVTLPLLPTIPLPLQPLLSALLPQPFSAPPLFKLPAIIPAWNIDAAARSRIDVTIWPV
jgi:hypothetical protein